MSLRRIWGEAFSRFQSMTLIIANSYGVLTPNDNMLLQSRPICCLHRQPIDRLGPQQASIRASRSPKCIFTLRRCQVATGTGRRVSKQRHLCTNPGAVAEPQTGSAAVATSASHSEESTYSFADEVGRRMHGSCLSKLSLNPGDVHVWWLFPEDVRLLQPLVILYNLSSASGILQVHGLILVWLPLLSIISVRPDSWPWMSR